MCKTPIYKAWTQMIQRCTNPKVKLYDRYGGRGIAVCERWMAKFQNFLDDMGPRPPGMTLDRKDNDGPYDPSNCRWASRAEQARNTSRNVLLTINGQTMTMKDWAPLLGLNYPTLRFRLRRGWSVLRAVTTPAKPHVARARVSSSPAE